MKGIVFKDKALNYIGNLCYDYESYNFVSEKEGDQASQNVMDLVLGDKELAVPVRNTAQDKYNDRMYELEKGKLERRDKTARARRTSRAEKTSGAETSRESLP